MRGELRGACAGRTHCVSVFAMAVLLLLFSSAGVVRSAMASPDRDARARVLAARGAQDAQLSVAGVTSDGVLDARFSCYQNGVQRPGSGISPRVQFERRRGVAAANAVRLVEEGTGRILWRFIVPRGPSFTVIPEGVPPGPEVLGWVVQGVNDFGVQGYSGPCVPPVEDRIYRFEVFPVTRISRKQIKLQGNWTHASLKRFGIVARPSRRIRLRSLPATPTPTIYPTSFVENTPAPSPTPIRYVSSPTPVPTRTPTPLVTLTPAITPTAPAPILTGVLQLSGSGYLGKNSMCALLIDGSVRCWGSGAEGRFGDGLLDVDRPLSGGLVLLPEAAVQVEVGPTHACAVLTSGRLMCWGSNDAGQLGTGSVGGVTAVPVAAIGLDEGVVQVRTALGSTCALMRTGAVKCWGTDFRGNLALGVASCDTSERKFTVPTPREVPGLAGKAVRLALRGGSHMCVLLESGKVMCWGDNAAAKLGTSALTNNRICDSEITVPYPVMVEGLLGSPVDLLAALRQSCAVLQSGGVKCWGSPSDDDVKARPHVVRDMIGLTTGVKKLTDRCAVMEAGTLKCWNLGIKYGSTDPAVPGEQLFLYLGPVDVPNLPTPIVDVAYSGGTICALLKGGTVHCFGENESGQTGRGSAGAAPAGAAFPVLASAPKIGGGEPLNEVSALAMDRARSCALRTSGEVWCWGQRSSEQIVAGEYPYRLVAGRQPHLATNVAQLSLADRHGCTVSQAGAAACWGDNSSAQLGIGTMGGSSIAPVQVRGLNSGVKKTVTGPNFSCALMNSGGVKCWGENISPIAVAVDQRQEYLLEPRDVLGMSSGVVDIAAGYSHVCVLMTGGAVKCWGYNSVGELGGGDSYLAGAGDRGGLSDFPIVSVVGLSSGVRRIANFGGITCAILESGKLMCWGRAVSGVYDYLNKPSGGVPVEMSGFPAGVADVALSFGRACVLLKNGAVYCWGRLGGLGVERSRDGVMLAPDGTSPASLPPTRVSSLPTDGRALAAGYGHTCLLTQAGEVWCWGDNGTAQLGVGEIGNRIFIPKRVLAK